MHLKTTVATLALGLATILFTVPASAQMMGGMGGGMGGHEGHMATLTPEQQQKADQIMEAHGKTLWTLHQQLKAKMIELDAATATPTPDDAKVKGLTRDIADLQSKLLSEKLAARQELEKAGIPTWGHGKMMLDGMGMKMGMGEGKKMGGMMGGKGCMMMQGMDHGAGAGGHAGHGGAAPAPGGDMPGMDHSQHGAPAKQ